MIVPLLFLAVAGTLACLIEWNQPLTPLGGVLLFVVWTCASACLAGIRSWWRIRQGLDQGPDPSGPYYDRWLALKGVGGDYYPWLAEQFDWAEPWASWAKADSQNSLLSTASDHGKPGTT